MAERRAYLCTHPDHGRTLLPRRVFLSPLDVVALRGKAPKCKDHPQRAMDRDPNRPYKGSKRTAR